MPRDRLGMHWNQKLTLEGAAHNECVTRYTGLLKDLLDRGAVFAHRNTYLPREGAGGIHLPKNLSSAQFLCFTPICVHWYWFGAIPTTEKSCNN